jgi:hypothetical protein
MLRPQSGASRDSTHSVTLNGVHDYDGLCLVFKGGPGELLSPNYLDFN